MISAFQRFGVSAFHLLTHLGPRWCLFRVRYALRVRSGALVRATPVSSWAAFGNDFAEGRFPEREASVALPADAAVLAEADAVESGVFRLYSAHDLACGFPPAWNTDPFTGRVIGADRHWSRIPDFGGGDIKDVWELSRFPWAFALARAHARDGRESRAESFWRLFESWLAANPPNLGPQWKCGQEATFRLMAAAFARYSFSGCPATTPARLAAWRAFVLATARRIAANLDYALSQSNNHGVSECVGLVTAALLLPGAPEAAGWASRGLAALRAQVESLVYPDGSFSQHSVNYHRVLVQDLAWCAALLRANDRPVPAWLDTAGRRAAGWLAAMTDPETGFAPCAGSNDGAHILPLAPGGYADFRPTLALACAVFDRHLPDRPSPWEESARWMAPGVSGRRAAPADSGQWHAPDGGWHLWSHAESRLLFHAPARFRHRPAQADLLHAGLSWRGFDLLRDPGSYSYNCAGPFAEAFKPARVHNTVTFAGREPLRKVGRFLYLPWPRGRCEATPAGLVASHDGWASLGAGHTRRILATDTGWRIEDRLTAGAPISARLHWLCADVPHELDLAARCLRLRTPVGLAEIRWSSSAPTAPGVSLVRADPESDRGWVSPVYRRVEPALSLAIESPVDGVLTLVTDIILQNAEIAAGQPAEMPAGLV